MANDKAIFHDEDCDSPTPETDLLETQPKCLKCGQTQRMMKCCTRCHAAFYCSKACFTKHWPVHKERCQPRNQRGEHSPQQSQMESGEGGKTMYRVKPIQKTVISPAINFQKAADDLAAKAAHPPPHRPAGKASHLSPTPGNITQSSSSTTAPLHHHSQRHNSSSSGNNHTNATTTTTTTTTDDSEADTPGVTVTLRYNKAKHSFKVGEGWEGAAILTNISRRLRCLPDTMRLIHKGRQLGADTVRGAVRAGAVFQVVGEPEEDAGGLEPRDIEVLMRQMGVERNVAVRALRQSQGDLIDAMVAMGNK